MARLLTSSVIVRGPDGRTVRLAAGEVLPSWAEDKVGVNRTRQYAEDANTEGVGADGADQGGDAASSGDGADSHDVGPAKPESAPEPATEAPSGPDEAEGVGAVPSVPAPDADLRSVLEDRDRDALLEDAKALGLDVDGRWGKARLVDAILAHHEEG